MLSVHLDSLFLQLVFQPFIAIHAIQNMPQFAPDLNTLAFQAGFQYLDFPQAGFNLSLVQTADVQREGDVIADDVRGAGKGLNAADRCDGVGLLTG